METHGLQVGNISMALVRRARELRHVRQSNVSRDVYENMLTSLWRS